MGVPLRRRTFAARASGRSTPHRRSLHLVGRLPLGTPIPLEPHFDHPLRSSRNVRPKKEGGSVGNGWKKGRAFTRPGKQRRSMASEKAKSSTALPMENTAPRAKPFGGSASHEGGHRIRMHANASRNEDALPREKPAGRRGTAFVADRPAGSNLRFGKER